MQVPHPYPHLYRFPPKPSLSICFGHCCEHNVNRRTGHLLLHLAKKLLSTPRLHWEILALSVAVQLGGIHINLFFGIRVPVKKTRQSPASLAASAFSFLKSKPLLLRVLQELHVLVIDEFCLVGAVLLSAVDLLLRRIRRNEHVFGGVCVFACGDHYQMEPIGQPHPLLSAIVRFNFKAIVMNHMYRAREDLALQNMITSRQVK